MPLLCADRLLLSPDDPLQDLPGLRHDEPQTVEVIEHFEQFRPLECGNRIGQLAAFAKCIDQVFPGFFAPLPGRHRQVIVHRIPS